METEWVTGWREADESVASRAVDFKISPFLITVVSFVKRPSSVLASSKYSSLRNFKSIVFLYILICIVFV